MPRKPQIPWSELQENVFQAVNETTENLIITAVAGGAKSTTLVEAALRYARRKENVGSRLAFLAFNKHIADELKGKLQGKVEAKTLHAMGYGALCYSLPKAPELRQNKVTDLLRHEVMPVTKGTPKKMRQVISQQRIQVKNLVSLFKNTLLPVNLRNVMFLNRMFGVEVKCPDGFHPPADIRLDIDPTEISQDAKTQRLLRYMAMLTRPIERTLELCQETVEVVDFDDMIWLPVVLAHRVRPKRYRMVFVDEAQDLNNCQIAFINRLARKGARLVAVGDPAQSIYVWRGARVDSMEQLTTKFSMRPLQLSVTYRCPLRHVRWARRLVPAIEPRPDAPEGRIELRWWANAMSECRSGDLVLCRTNAPLVRGALYQIRQGRKAVVRGQDLPKQLHRQIDDLTDLFKGSDDTLGELCMELERYRRQQAEENQNDERAQQIVDDRVETLLVLAENCETVEELKNYIDEIFSDRAEGIVFSTVHAAKGLEADRVVIIEPHKMPLFFGDMSPWDHQQEQNVLYVALTRAKQDLVIAVEPGTKAENLPDWVDEHDVNMDDRYGETDGGSTFRKARIQKENQLARIQMDMMDPDAVDTDAMAAEAEKQTAARKPRSRGHDDLFA